MAENWNINPFSVYILGIVRLSLVIYSAWRIIKKKLIPKGNNQGER